MRDLPANLIARKNLLSTDSAWLPVLDVDLDGTEYHYVRNHENLVLVGLDYTAAGCVAHWKLDDDLATTAVLDAGPNSIHAALQGGDNTEDKSAVGKINEAFELNGTDDYIQIPNNAVFDFGSDDFTYAIWFYPKAETRMALLAGTTDYWLGVDYHYQGTRNINIWASSTGSSWDMIISDPAGNGIGSVSLTLNAWNFIVVRRSGNNWTTYINNVKDVDITAAGSVANKSEAKRIGTWGLAYGFWLNGRIDNPVFFNRALSDAELSILYNAGNGTSYVPLTYTAFNFELDMGGDEAKGELPRWIVRVANQSRVLESALESLDGAVGESVIVRLVNSDYPGEYIPGLAKTFDIISTTSDAEWVTFTLSGINLLRRRFPLRRYMASHCRWVASFKGTECGYAGADTTCDGTLAACTDKSNAARFGGFPGLRGGSFRVV